MSPEKRRKREVLDIVLAAAAGDATEEQLARLSDLIVMNPGLAQYGVELLSQEAWLNWHGSQVNTRRVLEKLSGSALMPDGGRIECGNRLPDSGQAIDLSPVSPGEHRGGSAMYFRGAKSSADRTKWMPTIPSTALAASLVGIGILIGVLASQWPQQLRRAAENASRPSARFVQGTACVWGPGMKSIDIHDQQLRNGEALNLLEGLAEIEVDLASGGAAKLQIEGPARMVLTAEGAPSLTLGKFCADMQPLMGEFILETPLGQILASTDCSVGIAVYGLEVDVHVFAGEVAIESPWTPNGDPPNRQVVEAGRSLRLSAANSQAVQSVEGAAEPARFAAQTSMRTDVLEIPAQYVEEVLKSEPLVYWRFETDNDGEIPNAAGQSFRGKIFGSPSWAPQNNNRAIEFGAGLSDEVLHARVESDSPFTDEIVDSYTLEVWVKPSHYHLGTLSSLVSFPADENLPASHGALLELGGPLTTPSTIEHPGRIRFLHRDPPSDDAFVGTSCFSQGPYELRRWEHLVAVKDGGELRLYVNGELVAEAEDNSKLAPDLTLLVGQLDRNRDWCRFVGQLDELALYNRALSDNEIRAHFRLVRPKSKSARPAI